jgi:hypothetical protein
MGKTDAALSIRHSGTALNDVIEGAYRIVKDFDHVSQAIDTMKSLSLTPEQQQAFGRAALALKYEDPTNSGFEPKQIIKPRRTEDTIPNLWTTFNATQENMLKGGQRGIKLDANGRRVSTSSRPINGIDQNVALNRGLWTLAEEMGKLLNN